MPTRANFEFYNKNSTITGKQFGFRSEYRTPELWNEIASYCTRGTLHSLALVNTCTTDPAQRHLFKNLSFTSPYSPWCRIEHTTLDQAQAHLSRRMEELEMLSSSHLSNYVRHWEFRGMVDSPEPPRGRGKSHPGIPASAKAISRLIESLPQYPLLRGLTLIEIVVDHSTLLTISSMRNLSSLHFQEVVFECPPALENPLPLRHFLIEYADENYESDTLAGPIFLPSHLKNLTLIYDDTPETLLWSLLSELLTHTPHTNLVELTFQIAKPSPEGISLFFHLLERSPLLQTVRFTIFAWFEDIHDDFEQVMDQVMDEFDLDTEACPVLNNFACPPHFVASFGRGKPITKLYLQNYDARSTLHVAAALQAINGAILTELEFERTRTRSAWKILPLIHRLLPNLRVLRMPINDINKRREPYFTDLLDDGQTIEDPDDMKHERVHTTACYNVPGEEVRFDDGYLRLVYLIAQGLMPVPDTLVTLEITQNWDYKRMPFTQEHELQLVEVFAINFMYKNLQSLKIGMNEAYNRNWTKDIEGRWMKQRYYRRQDERNLVGTMCFSPVPNSSPNEFVRSFMDGVDAVELYSIT
ncbi:hypothetical protein CPC08DRAFT_766613 [Agrocybe pediades]|nr:hypothetical protein CPC08DRAFT_766613 [Agrocybe pediades]